MRTLLVALGIVLLGNVAVADAVEIMNVKAVPVWYGRVVSPPGQTAPAVVFNRAPIAVSMQEIDRMVHAFGLEHVVDASKAPRGLITAVKTKGADGKEMTTYVFSKKPQTLSAVAVSHGMEMKSYTFSRSAIGRSPVASPATSTAIARRLSERAMASATRGSAPITSAACLAAGMRGP